MTAALRFTKGIMLVFGGVTDSTTQGGGTRTRSAPRGFSGFVQHPFGVIRRNSRQLPEIPSGRRTGHLSHRNQAVGRRLLQPAFPSRDHHGRAFEVFAEIELIESKLLPQCSNPARPCWQGSGNKLTRPSHICLQDNKSRHILRCAHLSCSSRDWN